MLFAYLSICVVCLFSSGVAKYVDEKAEPEPTCGYNEMAVPCRQICPPQNCEIAYTDYACTEEHKICEPGCDCRPDHLRNGSGICVPNDQCPYPSTPVCGINEIARDCRRICPPQTCLSKYALFRCVADLPCEPGCDCIPNYLRDERGICIPSEKCSSPCQIPEECKRTCAEPNPPNCVYNPPEENIDGCDCKDGYILSEIGGKCIPIDQCPPEVACNGDPNASPKRCPKPCPSTCESPNQLPCKRMCEPIACECKSGFLLSNNTETARCILPDMCPGGNPCGKTGRFVDCKVDCPYDYCPVDDSRGLVFCDPPAEHCLSGCICTLNHKRKSRDDPKCIVSSKCPPVNCTRPNEKWSSCPSACLAENCEDVNSQPTVCNTLVLNCEPKCICKKNHFRNSSGICIRAKDCPPPGCGGDPNAVYSVCPGACPLTCTNPDPQICTEQCLEPGCVCRVGFVLNEDTGKCVERENCPVPVCEDPNAVYKVCPSACEPTCANPKPEVCTDQCLSPSCVCKEGFVLNEKEGKCTEIINCPDH
ncbi:hypothetical protein PYW08_015818 [Mythimna loreyi]|uniref:Uncharacterized protein n=1 Tax=Mythimna loreyi TaxID=667449 RepID=A0ACC2QUD2_9NEOP|nr:hypothetical protein PYW08_015818 [Mythimna loreyi]